MEKKIEAWAMENVLEEVMQVGVESARDKRVEEIQALDVLWKNLHESGARQKLRALLSAAVT